MDNSFFNDYASKSLAQDIYARMRKSTTVDFEVDHSIDSIALRLQLTIGQQRITATCPNPPRCPQGFKYYPLYFSFHSYLSYIPTKF
jgi:hypothetical protein